MSSSSSPRLATAAADVLAREPVEASPSDAASRERAVVAIRAALAARARRRARTTKALGAVAALALAAGVMFVVRSASTPREVATPAPAPSSSPARVDEPAPGVYVDRRGTRVPARIDDLGPDDHVLAGERPGTLALRRGTFLDLEPESDVRVVDDGTTERIVLVAGAITAHVSKRARDERFLVVTPDAEVEVRGTVFRVARGAMEPCHATGTTVNVVEGRVVVRSAAKEAVLGASEAWASACPPPRAIVERPTPKPAGTTNAPKSDLAEQNALFESAMAAKGRGDTTAALASFEKLLTSYPRSPLREAALAQAMRLAKTAEPARARALAATYLREYPNGPAAAEADAVSRGP